MIACVHQPNYLPWLGFFAKIARSDIYVVMDNVQFPNRCWTNRVQIAGKGAPLWLTVPVRRRDGLATLITDVEVDYSHDWVKKQRHTLEARYSRCPHFKNIYPQLAQLIETRPGQLVELNIPLIRWVLETLGITTRVVLGSELNAAGKASELIVAMCRAVGATAYLAGEGSADYENLAVYKDAGIRYHRNVFRHPQYSQHGQAEFVRGLSVLDALFNMGIEGTKQVLAEPVAFKGTALE